MDPAAPFGTSIDTFSKTFSSDQYAALFATNPQVLASPELATQGFPFDPLATTANPFGSTKSPISPSNNPPPAPNINPRSCTTCRKRKVRCDKKHPCSNCQKAGIECIFPRPGRAPRRSKKPPDTELLARLRRLEGVVQSLGKGVDGEDLSPAHTEGGEGKENEGGDSTNSHESSGRPPGASPGCIRGQKASTDTTGLEKEMGRLVVGDGRSRYVSNNFWASLTSEVAEMHDILDDPTDDEEDHPTPESDPSSTTSRANHQAFMFGYSSTMLTLRILHPPTNQIPLYWELYKENVDPLIRLLHAPTIGNLLMKAAENLDSLSKGTEALIFAIYLATVTSVSSEQCKSLLQQDKDIAIQRYRFATEQALARAAFLETQEVMVLQAFTLFLVSVRRHDDSRFVWTMTGLATRIANALGIHRDGAQFGLSPFETEMRRRLWWQVCTLDIRASEDQSSDPTITEQSFDTKLPLNINDEDIWPEMTEPPKEHEGCTEMTFDLIRYEISNTVRFLTYTPPGPCPYPMRRKDGASVEEKEHLIEKLQKYLEEKYLKHCDMSNPLQWVATNVARLVLAKMWLIVHHPFQRTDGGAGIPQDTKDRLFRTSVDVIRYSRTLESQKSTVKWGWLFRTYVQWHAVAYILSELCVRTTGPEVDETWQIMDSVFEDWGGTVTHHKKGMLWKPIRRLMVKARAARARALERAVHFPSDGTLGPGSLKPSTGPRIPLPGTDENSAFMPLPLLQTEGATKTEGATRTDSFSTPSMPDIQTQSTMSNTGGFDPEAVNHWMLNDPTLLQDSDENMNWAGWDDMVKDFQMEIQQDQPVPFSIGSWW